MDPDPRVRLVLERHIEELVRPTIVHERVRGRVYRQMRRELKGLGYGWWRRRRMVRVLRREVARRRKEPQPFSGGEADVIGLALEALMHAVFAAF